MTRPYLVPLLVLLVACGDAASPPAKASVSRDSGSVEAGVVDTGAPDLDTGAPLLHDAGGDTLDAAVPNDTSPASPDSTAPPPQDSAAPDTSPSMDSGTPGEPITCNTNSPQAALDVQGPVPSPEAGAACVAAMTGQSGPFCPAFQGNSGCVMGSWLAEDDVPPTGQQPFAAHTSLSLGAETPWCSGLPNEYPCCLLEAHDVGGTWEFNCTCYGTCSPGATTTENWQFD